jgi:hypothetical protein
MRNVQVDQEEVKLNGTYQFLIYADDVNVMSENIITIKKNREALL